ncbi:MAG: arylsulfatase [Verrucomicrobiota bacterium]
MTFSTSQAPTWFIKNCTTLLLLILSIGKVEAKAPNILIIVADDLGYSDLGSYGGEIDTPHLDALAKGGVRLTQFYTMGRCCPSRASILTGQYPHRVGLGHMTQDIHQPGYRGQVSDQAQTIAQVLKPAGYRSFISGKWHLGTADPTQHGFEEFYGTLTSAKRYFDPDHLIRLPEGRKKITYPPGEFYATDAVTDHALSFLKQAHSSPQKPWFIYLAYNAPHFPLHARPEDIAKYQDRFHDGWDVLRKKRLARMKELGIIAESTELTPRSPYWNYGESKTGTNPAWNSLSENRRLDLARRMAIYAAMVDRMDQQIGRVIDELKSKGEFNNTLIMFLSDNGACAEWDPNGFDIKSSNQNILHEKNKLDEMGKAGTFHSIGSAWANAANTPWRLYKHFSHEGGINSPCIVHWPAGLGNKAGRIDHQPAHIIDLMTSAIAVSGASYTGTLDLPGKNLIAQLQNAQTTQRTLYFEHEGNRAIRDGDWKLVSLRDQRWELYDFSKTRTELENVAEQHPDIVKKLNAKWETWAKKNLVTPLPTDYQVDYLRITK